MILRKDNDYLLGLRPGIFHVMILQKDIDYSPGLRPVIFYVMVDYYSL